MNRCSRSLIVLSLGVIAGCFAAKLPPPMPQRSGDDLRTLSVAVRVPSTTEFADINRSIADSIVEDLRRTRLFRDVHLSAEGQSADLIVEFVESKRPDPSDWCYESLAYVGFTLFLIPGCAESYGYRLRVSLPAGSTQDFDFAFEERVVAGWVALFLLPSPDWRLPQDDWMDERKAEHLASQLRSLLHSVPATQGEGT